ncbi:hypothetical protein SD70_27250 [Gordoniibacillus kamchatkensis]|uniref:Phage protein n=1 Tax=Gordoniibacillus kamchatkensis TaxID=1590651 RepID=A0ABR5ABH4_9BACL|nr:hypothetical protein SD70_27250 [Paenibacillus sp. VKM B-2647]
MSWQILNVEPAYGICDQCKKHDCGIVDGEHKWIMTGTYDRVGDPIVIGYKCVEMWANNLGISRVEVEKEVRTPPTQEEVGAYLRHLISNSVRDETLHIQAFTTDRPAFESMEAHEIYLWLTANKIDADLKKRKTLQNLRTFAIEKYNEMATQQQ